MDGACCTDRCHDHFTPPQPVSEDSTCSSSHHPSLSLLFPLLLFNPQSASHFLPRYCSTQGLVAKSNYLQASYCRSCLLCDTSGHSLLVGALYSSTTMASPFQVRLLSGLSFWVSGMVPPLASPYSMSVSQDSSLDLSDSVSVFILIWMSIFCLSIYSPIFSFTFFSDIIPSFLQVLLLQIPWLTKV